MPLTRRPTMDGSTRRRAPIPAHSCASSGKALAGKRRRSYRPRLGVSRSSNDWIRLLANADLITAVPPLPVKELPPIVRAHAHPKSLLPCSLYLAVTSRVVHLLVSLTVGVARPFSRLPDTREPSKQGRIPSGPNPHKSQLSRPKRAEGWLIRAVV